MFRSLVSVASIAVGLVRADYSYGSSYASPGYAETNSSAYYYQDYSPATANKRVFTPDNQMTFDVTFDVTMPLPDLNSAVEISVPFSFDIPAATTITTKRSATGRALSGSGASVRSGLYRHMENIVGQMSGGLGGPCLLRAMCEVASHPRHGDGLLGDAINFLLGGAGHAHLAEEQDERFRGYEAAQARGAAGECSAYHAECPLSFFKLIGDNEL